MSHLPAQKCYFIGPETMFWLPLPGVGGYTPARVNPPGTEVLVLMSFWWSTPMPASAAKPWAFGHVECTDFVVLGGSGLLFV